MQILTRELQAEYYQALLDKNSQYEGVFFVGVKSTGIFCRPTCPARKPKFQNCEFFSDTQSAQNASYRPCKRCRPLASPGEMSQLVQTLVDALEADPTRRWSEEDGQAIAYGDTRSYAELARALGNPTAYRAVAQANGANKLAIIIPCHRIINSNGKLAGYGGGLARKQWLLDHEKKNR